MVKHFIQMEWKAFFRSESFGKGLAVKLFLHFLNLIFLALFFMLGLGLYPILKKIFPDKNPMQTVNQFLLIWLFAGFVFRFFFQKLPVINIKPLLIQNIKRNTIIHFLLLKSFFSSFNLFTPLVAVPFGVACAVSGHYSGFQIFAWLVAVLSSVFGINYFNTLFKSKFNDDLKGILPFVAIILIFIGLEKFNLFSITEQFGRLCNFSFQNPILFFVPIFFPVLFYRLNFKYLRSNFYFDANLKKGKSAEISTADLSWTKRFGSIAPFLQLDLKLIWRNKRAKSTIWFPLIFLLYGLMIYGNSTYAKLPAFLIFTGIFMTSSFVTSFGQFIPAWDSGYYSMMMSQNIPMKQYLTSKASLMYFSIAVLTLLATPYIYFGIEIFFINIACAVYNAGVNVPLTLYVGSFNKKRIELDQSATMNYQGVGASQWLLGFPLVFVPTGIWFLFYKIFDTAIATVILGIIGITALVLRNIIMEKIVNAYKKRKYSTLQGFKEK